ALWDDGFVVKENNVVSRDRGHGVQSSGFGGYRSFNCAQLTILPALVTAFVKHAARVFFIG
ncbi:MAG: hypothetical protein AAGK79_19785, partial [Pseudomonadota bacterium]